MNSLAYSRACLLVVQHAPQHFSVPRTPVVAEMSVSQHHDSLRGDVVLLHVLRYAVDVRASSAGGFGQ